MLDAIVTKVRANIENRSRSDWENEIAARAAKSVARQARFGEMISRPGGQLILEIKRKSPSAGTLSANVDVASMAQAYEQNGAAAISVLTEQEHFGGSLSDLQQVAGSVSIPILRKDFIVDPLQIHEAAALCASAVLLIVAILDHQELRQLLRLSAELQLDALVEVHDEFELSRALAANARIIGVNNRNLKTMTIDLTTGERILKRIPGEVIKVAESGIRTRADILRMQSAGAHACLIGTSLMTTNDIETKIKELRGQ